LSGIPYGERESEGVYDGKVLFRDLFKADLVDLGMGDAGETKD